LVFIRTQTNRRFYIFWKWRIQVGLTDKCDIIINHPVFLNKTSLLKTSLRSESSTGRKSGLMKHLFLTRHLKEENLLINIFSPGWTFYVILMVTIILFTILNFSIVIHTGSHKQDWTPVTLPAEGTFGFCRQDRTHPEGICFLFDSRKSCSHNLVFTAGSGNSDAVLSIYLNESDLFTEVALPLGWGEEVSFRLPLKLIRPGPNKLLLRIKCESCDVIGWGIRNVRIIQEDIFGIANSNISSIDEIRVLLQRKNLTGYELARYYQVVERMHVSETKDEFYINKKTLKKEIEQRMEEIIKENLIRSRAALMMGDNKTANLFILNTKLWIPENWIRGMEIINGITN
jgi:hypothetical protein